MRKLKKKKKGFTLIELLVVIILIGLISLIVVPIVSDIISNSKKEAFKRSVEGLAREYEYKELSDNIRLGEVDACSFQETCKIQGTVKRDEENNMYAYVTDGTYCVNGKVSQMRVVRGTCGLNGEELGEITFNDKTITKDYEEVTKDIELEVSGGSSGYEFTKVSETKDGVNSDSILILNDGIIRIPAKTNAGEYDLVVKVLDNITQEEKEANIKIIINRIDITEITLNNIESVNYDGTEHEPEPAVVLKGKTLKKDVEFEYSYLNNKNAGTATVKVTGIGNYVGEITKTFTINRVNAVNTSIVGATLTYNTLNQSLVESVNISNSHVYYSVGTMINSENYENIGSETRPTRSEAGTYTVYYYAPSDNYNEVSGSITSIINPKVLEIPVSPAVKTYNESFQDSGITCPTGSTESGSTSEINAGTYTQTCTLSSTNNYKWNDNTTTAKNISWVISKLNTATTGSCIARTYTGSSQTIVSSGSYVSYSTTTGVNAGSYSITVTSDSNHTFSDGGTSKTLSCSIAKATPTMNLSSTEGTHKIGTSGSITVTGSNYGTLSCGSSNTSIATCSVSGTTVTITPKAVGTATITVYGSGNTNYNSISKTYAATIELGYRCTDGTLTYDATKGANSGGYICTKAGTYDSTYSCNSSHCVGGETCQQWSATCYPSAEPCFEESRRCHDSCGYCDHYYNPDDSFTACGANHALCEITCNNAYESCMSNIAASPYGCGICYSSVCNGYWQCDSYSGGYVCGSGWSQYSGTYGNSDLVCYKQATL